MSAPDDLRRSTISVEPDECIVRYSQPATEPDSCRMCSAILGIIYGSPEDEYDHQYYTPRDMQGLLDMACPHVESMISLWETIDLDDKGSPHLWSVRLIQQKDGIGFEFWSQEKHRNFFRTLELVARSDQPNHSGTSRLLDSQWIDLSIPRSWYNECVVKHGSSCSQPPWATTRRTGANGYPEWLIDAEELCIVPFDMRMTTYFTLSYTWGVVEAVMTTKANLAMLRKPLSLHQDNNNINISRTVRDAVNITRSLGHRYIWVDRLCIIQDDQDALFRSLNAMHQIYANSALCLVAFAGKDADHGLRGVRGVSEPRKVGHHAFNLAGGEQLSYFYPPPPSWRSKKAKPAHETGSAWDERGWTFQEFIFSKRRLVFTDGALRWVCSNGNQHEEEAHDTSTSDPFVAMPSVDWMQRPLPALDWINRVAVDFNKRHFRLPEDAPRAFLGVQNFMNSYFKGGLLYGHPEMFFEYSLLWEAGGNMKRRVASTSANAGEGVLPSWSWLGWHGDFYFLDNMEDEVAYDEIIEPVAQWFAMKSPTASPSEIRPINSTWHHHKMLAQKHAKYLPEGWVKIDGNSGPFCYQYRDGRFRYPVPVPSSTEVVEPTLQLPFIFAQTTRAFFTPKLGRNSTVRVYSSKEEYVGFLEARNTLDVNRLLELETVELVAVAKGWSIQFHEHISLEDGIEELRSDCYFVLCVEWEDGVAICQASGRVYSEAWEKAQEPVDLVLG